MSKFIVLVELVVLFAAGPARAGGPAPAVLIDYTRLHPQGVMHPPHI